MEPKTAKSTLTRARIQDAVLGLFSRGGFQRTTMRAIAAEAGISTGNAYYHFASKVDLVQDLARALVDDQLRATRPLLGSGNNLRVNVGSRLTPSWTPSNRSTNSALCSSARPWVPIPPPRRMSPGPRGSPSGVRRSPLHRRSRRLAANTAALRARLAVLSRLPVVGHIIDDLIGVVRNVQRTETGLK